MDKETIGKELARYNITDTAIANMAGQFMQLVVTGLEDKEGLAAVHNARMTVKNKRIEVEKCRKALKEDSLKFGRAVDMEAKRITALLEPIETYLESEEDKIARIKAEIKAEEERVAKAAEEARLKALEEARLAEIEAQAKVERERLAAVEAEQAAMKKRLDEVAKQQAAEQAKLLKERLAMEAERKAFEDERRQAAAAERRAAELQKAKADAAEEARREAEEEKERALQAERDRVEAERLAAENARLEAEAAERERAEAERIAAEERPDKEKLLEFSKMLTELSYPTVNSERGVKIVAMAHQRIDALAADIHKLVKQANGKKIVATVNGRPSTDAPF
jgi:colicin import membrane protein